MVGHAPAFLRDPVGLLERGHRERGDVFSLRFGRRRAVVLLGPEHHEFFFKETDRRLSIRTAYPFFVRMFDEQFYFFAGPEEYHRQRSLVAPRFQGRQLDGYVEVMTAETSELMEGMGEGGELDLIPTLGPLVMPIAARASWGQTSGVASAPGSSRSSAASRPGWTQSRPCGFHCLISCAAGGRGRTCTGRSAT